MLLFKGTLKPYQPEAVDMMIARKTILVAYEMGLGKTPMTIAALEELRNTKELKGPVLVIVLSSLKYQWQKEIIKFSDSAVTVVDGTKPIRQSQYSTHKNVDYVVTNYESVVNDWDIVRAIKWGAIICDEATAIKGFRSQRSRKETPLNVTL